MNSVKQAGVYIIKGLFWRYYKNLKSMKTKLLSGFFLLSVILALSSCATSKKYGCPSVAKVEKKVSHNL